MSDESDLERAGETGPVLAPSRIESLDTLRGVAVLGILVMNIYAFAMPSAAYSNPLAYGGTDGFNMGVWFFTHLFFEQKFMTIFAMLFGAGLVMMSKRAAVSGTACTAIWYRRNFWLLIIGAVHGYFLWYGDILFAYAATGFLIYPLRHKRPRTLILIACCLLPFAMLNMFAGGYYVGKLQGAVAEIQQLQEAGTELSAEQIATMAEWKKLGDFALPIRENVQNDLAAYQKTYAEIVAYRAPTVVGMQTDALIYYLFWRIGGVMLIGMALMKLGVFSADRSLSFYKKMLLAGYGSGIPLVIYSAYALHTNQWDQVFQLQAGMVPNYIGSLLVALGHVALIMLLIKCGFLANIMRRFAAVGRLALTNYLLHSMVMTTLFYGYGFGLFGQIPRTTQMLLVVVMLGLQLVISPNWLRNFYFGPAEWLWRSLTYWEFQPMKRIRRLHRHR